MRYFGWSNTGETNAYQQNPTMRVRDHIRGAKLHLAAEAVPFAS
jgi:hypothetical protein